MARVLLVLLLTVGAVGAARAAASAATSAGALGAGAEAGAEAGGAGPRPAVTVRVALGDTLWGIALRHAPAGTDPRRWIYRTAQLNGLHSALIVPGEILRLPLGSR